MRATFIRLTIAIVLAIAAWLSWSEAKLTREVGDAKQQIATLQFQDVPAALEAGATLSDNLPDQRD